MNSTLTKESTRTKIFQETESACWETCHCPSMIKNECPATKYTYLPCWEIEGTYCKLNDYRKFKNLSNSKVNNIINSLNLSKVDVKNITDFYEIFSNPFRNAIGLIISS